MNEQVKSHEAPGLLLTGARYIWAERIARRVRDDKPVTGEVIGFIAADILDGVILRKFNADTPIRRAADGIVDQVSMARVIWEAGRKDSATWPYLGMLATRALLIAGANGLHFAKTGEVTKGGNKQRAANLALAAFGLISLAGNKKATHFAGIAASGVAAITAVPHFHGVGEVNKRGIRKI